MFDKHSGTFLTWFGYSTFHYEINATKKLLYPMLDNYVPPFLFMVARYPYRLPASATELPDLDAVIISHDHSDHRRVFWCAESAQEDLVERCSLIVNTYHHG